MRSSQLVLERHEQALEALAGAFEAAQREWGAFRVRQILSALRVDAAAAAVLEAECKELAQLS
eukprot:6824335-Prymnesium_polylepis.1